MSSMYLIFDKNVYPRPKMHEKGRKHQFPPTLSLPHFPQNIYLESAMREVFSLWVAISALSGCQQEQK